MKIEPLPWDSDFFDYKVGRCSLNDEDSWENEKLADWNLVYFFINPDQLKANKEMQKRGIALIDEKVTFVMHLSTLNNEAVQANEICSYTKDSQFADVIRIGVQSGIYSRFYRDSMIPKKKFEDLYTKWMIRSILREIAREVFVYKINENQVAGVITLGDKNGRTDIGIIAVDEKFRGLSIGKKLVMAAIKNSIDAGHTTLQVVTQKSNHLACRFYEQCGFRVDHVVNIYHYWNRK